MFRKGNLGTIGEEGFREEQTSKREAEEEEQRNQRGRKCLSHSPAGCRSQLGVGRSHFHIIRTTLLLQALLVGRG